MSTSPTKPELSHWDTLQCSWQLVSDQHYLESHQKQQNISCSPAAAFNRLIPKEQLKVIRVKKWAMIMIWVLAASSWKAEWYTANLPTPQLSLFGSKSLRTCFCCCRHFRAVGDGSQHKRKTQTHSIGLQAEHQLHPKHQVPPIVSAWRKRPLLCWNSPNIYCSGTGKLVGLCCIQHSTRGS